jgi:alkylated DNA repair dioxygenase AlkB
MSPHQVDLFATTPKYPEGFRYQPELIDAATEARMLERIASLPFREFEFHGYMAKRRVVLQHVLVMEYGPGAAIGWHRDKSAFGEIVGISLRSACTFRLRRAVGARWERVSLSAEPRSAYLLSGAARSEWEPSIPAVDALRYSVTFRNLRG